MPTVHNLSVQVPQITKWHFTVLSQIIMQHIGADLQVTIVETIVLTPSLATKSSSPQNKRMEYAQRK